MTKKLNSEQWKSIKERIARGEHIVNLAKEFKISRNSIYVYFRRRKLTNWGKIKRYLFNIVKRAYT